MNATQQRISVFFIILVLYVAAALMQQQLLFNWDVSWLMHVTQKLLAGGNYTNDFFELNPPLIIYLYVPAVWINTFFSLSPMVGLQIYIFILATFSLCCCSVLIPKIFRDRGAAQLFLLAVTAILLIVPLYDFGQREHLFVIFSLPYFLLVSSRLEGHTFSRFFAAGIGLFASFGLALKPYFLIAPLMVEMYYLASQRQFFCLFRAETIMIAVFLIGYLGFIDLVHHDYFTVIVPYATHTYYSIFAASWINIFGNPLAIFCEIVVIMYFVLYQKNPYKVPSTVLVLAMLGMLISYLVQRTLWHYHILPAYAVAILLAIVLFGMLVASPRINKAVYFYLFMLDMIITFYLIFGVGGVQTALFFYPGVFYGYFSVLVAFLLFVTSDRQKVLTIFGKTFIIIAFAYGFSYMVHVTEWYSYRFYITILFIILLFGAVVPGKSPQKIHAIFFLCSGMLIFAFPLYNTATLYHNAVAMRQIYRPLTQFMQFYAAHQHVYFFCSTVNCEYPYVDYAAALPSSRTSDIKWVAALQDTHTQNTPTLQHDKQYMTQMVIEDLLKNKPHYIFVDISTKKAYFTDKNFSYIDFFSKDPAFRALWKSYQYFSVIDIPNSIRLQVYKYSGAKGAFPQS